MIMSIFKKVISVVLCAIMVFSIIPVCNIETEAATYASINLNVPWYSMRHKNGCGISSLAMVEGYVKGYGDNDWTCYSAVYNKSKEIYPDNPVVLYSYSAIGYTTISNSLSSVYEQLKKGNPVVVYRTNADRTLNHFSVIYGYSGSTTSLEKKGFKVKNTIYDSSYSAISWTDAQSKGADTNLETWLKGANWTQTLIRTSNKITSLPNKKNTVQVSFNANGGSSSASSGTYVVGEIYGNTMPSATRAGYTFDGWFTSASGGTRVNRSTSVTSGDKTLYAHWIKNETDVLEIDRVYRIYNEKSGLVVAADDTKKGKYVCQRKKGDKGKNELWRVTGIDGDGCYSFEVIGDCKFALDVDSDNKYAFGQSLQVWEKVNNNAQKFSIVKRDDKSGYSGLYSIHSKNSGRAIDVSDSSTEAGAALHQWDYHGSNNQLFYFEEVETRNITFYDNFNNNYIASPAEEYAHINSATPTGHYSSRAADYVKVTLKPDTDTLYIQSLKAGSSGNDMKWLTLINGSYEKEFCIENNSTMVLNFKAKSSVSGAKIYFRWGHDSEYQSVTLTNSWADYSVELKRTSRSGNNIHPYIDKACNVEITDISLYEKGTTGYIGDTDAYTAQTVVANVNNDYIQPAPLPRNTKSGYTFNGWYTKRIGGTRVAGAAEYFSAPLDGDQCLYAHWTKSTEITYTLTYNANGGTGAPSSQNGAESYTISSTVPVRNGYTFIGWSTNSSAASATYFAGENITLTQNTTLYAVWEEVPVYNIYNLVYDANGGSGAPEIQSFTEGQTIKISDEIPECFGYKFNGWHTADGEWYYPGDEAAFYENTTLYASWAAVMASVYSPLTLAFDGETQEHYVGFAPEQSGYYVIETVYTDDCLDTVGILHSSTGDFITESDDNGSDRNFRISHYLNEDELYFVSVESFDNINGSTVLKITRSQEVVFDANGGYGAPQELTGDYRYILPFEEPHRDGYVFMGWTMNKNTNSDIKQPGDTIEITGTTITGVTTLYAVWEKTESPTNPNPDDEQILSEFLTIRTPSVTEINYGDSIFLHADLNRELPEGWYVKWTSSNDNFGQAQYTDNRNLIFPKKSGDTVFTATVYDNEGNVICSDTQVMTAKAGFFQKIIAFFKNLFGLTKTISEAFNYAY